MMLTKPLTVLERLRFSISDILDWSRSQPALVNSSTQLLQRHHTPNENPDNLSSLGKERKQSIDDIEKANIGLVLHFENLLAHE